MTTVESSMPPLSRRATVFRLALPIIGGMISQNVLNLVDTAMVGTLGDGALAAVGLASFANFFCASLVLGLSAAVQALAARRMGAARDDDMALPLNGGLMLAVALATPWATLLHTLAPVVFPRLTTDPAVAEPGVAYLQARLWGMPALAMNFAFRGYWNAVNLSRLYMRTLIVMHLANVTLNWVLIFGNLGAPALGVTGAGIASTMAAYLGTAQYFALAAKHARTGGYLRSRPDAALLRSLLRIAIPAGVQQLLFSGGMLVFYWIAGQVGTATLAATTVIFNMLLVGILPSLAFGFAAASLVGQALGRADPHDARSWGWDVVKSATRLAALLSLPPLLWPELLLGIFIRDPNTLALAVLPFRLVALSLCIDAVGLVLLHALQGGAGAGRLALAVSGGLQWFVGLPAAYLVGPVLGGGIVGIFLAQFGYRTLQALVLARIWQRGTWAALQIEPARTTR